jgi:hypothetical protein
MSVSRRDLGTGVSGVNLQYAPKAASTVITERTLVTRDSAGRLVPAAAGSTSVLGVALSRVTAADADYAATSLKAYDEAREGDVFLMDIVNTTNVVPGLAMTLLNAGTIDTQANIGGATQVVIKRIVSSTKVEVTLKTPTL